MGRYWQGTHSELAYLASLCDGPAGQNSAEALSVHRPSASQLESGRLALQARGSLIMRGGLEMASGREAAVCGMLQSAQQWIGISVEDSSGSGRILYARGPWGSVLVRAGEDWQVMEPRADRDISAQIAAAIAAALAHKDGGKTSVRQHSLERVGHVTVFGAPDGPWLFQPVIGVDGVPRGPVDKAAARAWLTSWLGLDDSGTEQDFCDDQETEES